MNDSISRQAAIDMFQSLAYDDWTQGAPTTWSEAYWKCAEIIRDMPQVSQKTGYWKRAHGYATPGGDPVWCCSECGKGVHVYGIEHSSYGADISDGQWVACPNCGARMEGEQDG